MRVRVPSASLSCSSAARVFGSTFRGGGGDGRRDLAPDERLGFAHRQPPRHDFPGDPPLRRSRPGVPGAPARGPSTASRRRDRCGPRPAAGAAGCSWRSWRGPCRRRSAISSCDRFASSASRRYACASSIAFRFSRWMFSMSATWSSWSSGTSRTTTGTLSRPARCAARQRRSPATISNRPSTRRTRTGCSTPCAANRLRELLELRLLDVGARLTRVGRQQIDVELLRRRVAARAGGGGAASGISALSPRPNAGRFSAMRLTPSERRRRPPPRRRRSSRHGCGPETRAPARRTHRRRASARRTG